MSSDALYNGLLADVNALIDELGTSYTLYRPGVYDPATMTTGAETSRTVDGVLTEQNILALGTEVTWTAGKKFVMKAAAAPLADEEVEIDGHRNPMTNVEKIKPANIIVAYQLDVSR